MIWTIRPGTRRNSREHTSDRNWLRARVLYSARAACQLLTITLAALLTSLVTVGPARAATWTATTTGPWSIASNWSGGTIADGVGVTANLTSNITGARTITIDSTSRTLGIVNIGDTNHTNSFTLASSGGASLIFNNNGAAAQLNQVATSNGDTISAPISIQGSLVLANAATTANAPLTLSGGITGGTSGLLSITNSGTNATGNGVTISGIIADGGGGTVAVTQSSATSPLTLSGSNSFSGGVNLAAGNLTLSHSWALGTGPLTISGGSLDSTIANLALSTSNAQNWNGNFTFIGGQNLDLGPGAVALNGNRTVTLNASTLTVGGNISGGSLTVAGAGKLILTGSNSYGATVVNGATLQTDNSGSLAGWSSPGNVSVSAGVLAFSLGGTGQWGQANIYTALGNIAWTGGASVGIKVDSGNTPTFDGSAIPSSPSLGLVKLGGGGLILIGSNTYTGSTNITAGTLQVGDGSANTGSLPGNVAISTTGNALVFNTPSGGTLSVAGNISSTVAGNVLKLGPGLAVLGGTNSYTGTTTVSAGALRLLNASAVPSTSALTLSAATLQLRNDTAGTTFSHSNAVTLSGASTVDVGPATNGSPGLALAIGNMTTTTASTLSVTSNSGTSASTLNIGTYTWGGLAVTINPTTGNVAITNINAASGTTTATLGSPSAASVNTVGTITKTGGNQPYTVSGGTWTIGAVSSGSGVWTVNGGLVIFTGTNTYTGATNINSGGIVNYQNATALGSTSSITVAAGATAQVQSGIAGGANVLTISGSGAAGTTGALESLSGTNSYSGPIALTGATTVSSDLGTLTLSGSMSGAFPLTLAGAGNGAISGRIVTGSGSLTKKNAGTWTLSGSNTYSGLTTVNGGTLNLANSSAVQNSTLTMNGGAIVFDSSAGGAFTFGSLSAAGSGSGYDIALVDNTSNPVALTVGGNNASTTYAAALTGGSLIKAGTGSLTLGGNSFLGSGTLTVNGGLVDLAGGQMSAAAVALNNGILADSLGTGLLRSPNYNVFNGTISAALGDSGSSTLIKNGPGTVILSGSNSYSGGTTIVQGILEASGTASLPGYNVAGTVAVLSSSLSTTTLMLGVGGANQWASPAIDQVLSITGSGPAFASGTAIGFDTSGGNFAYGSNIPNSTAGSLGLVKAGANTLTLSGSNSYTGATTISAGALGLGSSAALAGHGNITFAGGSLQFTAGNTVDYSNYIVNSASAISIDTNGRNPTFAGVLASSNSAGLTKLGLGTLVLTGSNRYSGATTVNGGTLVLGGSAGAIASSSGVILNPAGALTLDNTVNNNTARLNGINVTANGGKLNFNHPGAALTNYADSMGTLNLNAGQLTVNTSQANGDGSTSGLTIASLNRAAGGTFRWTGAGVGTATNSMTLVTSSTLSNGILPYAVMVDSLLSTTAGVNFATITSGQMTPYTGYETTPNVTVWTANTINARPASGLSITVAGTINSLVLDDGVNLTTPNTSDKSLSIGSLGLGALLQSGGTSSILSDSTGDSTIDLGFGTAAPREAVFHVLGTLILGGDEQGQTMMTAKAGLTKSGSGTLQIGNDVYSSKSPFLPLCYAISGGGAVNLNDGVLDVYTGNLNSLQGFTGGVNFNGGKLIVRTGTRANTNDALNIPVILNTDATISNDRRASVPGDGPTVSFTTLSIGSNQLTIAGGDYVTSGIAEVTFTGNATLNGNPTFNVTNPTGGGSLTDLTLGSLQGGTTPRNITKTGNGSLTLSASSVLAAGSVFNLTAGTLKVANPAGSATGLSTVTLNGGVLAGTTFGGTIGGLVQAGAAAHTIAAGAGLSAGQYGILNLNGGLSTNAFTTLAFNFNPVAISGSIYGGDLINLGGSAFTVSGGSITIGVNPTTAGDYRLFANAGSILGLSSFSLPTQPNWTYSLSSTVDSGFIDLVAAPASLSGSSAFSLAATSLALRVMQNSTGTANTASVVLSNTGAAAGGFSSSAGGAAAAVNPTSGTVNAGGTQPLGLGWSDTTLLGSRSGTLIVSNATNASDPFNTSGNTISMSGAVVAQRSVTAQPVDLSTLGVRHVGANLAASNFTATLSSTASDNSYTRVTVSGGTVQFDGSGGLGQSQTRSLSGPTSLALAGSGTLPITLTVTGEGLAGEGSYAGLIVPYTGAQVFSGSGRWALSGTSGTWNDNSHWTAVGGGVGAAPGTFAGFTGDTAILDTSGGTVSLDGIAPQLAGLTFGGTSGYTILQGSGTSQLTLGSSGSSALVAVAGGNHTISAPILLGGNLAVNTTGGASLELSGDIQEAATSSLTLSGNGQLILSGSNSYTGGTTVNGGTLLIVDSDALPAGQSLSIGSGGTLIFDAGLAPSPGPSLLADRTVTPGASPAAVAAVPEPGSFVLLAVAALVGAMASRRHGRCRANGLAR